MKHEIRHQPAFPLVAITLEVGDVVTAEAGAMATRSSNVSMRTRMNAGRSPGLFARIRAFFVAFVRKLVGGETFFVNDFSADGRGEVTFAPPLSGHIVHRRLHGDRLILQSGAFLACAGEVDMRLRWGGLRALFSREGLFLLELSGHGDLWFSAYGGIQAIKVDGTFVVDTGHFVGFDGELDFKLRSAGGGVLGFVASGEGLVCEFQGKGIVYVQTRNESALASWLGSYG